MTIPLPRRLFAEFLGSAFLAALVIGSGIAAQQLSPNDTGLAQLANAAATAAGLFAIILMVRSGRDNSAPAAVGAYIGAAYWFTSSTSFANPAITVGRMFSNTFAGVPARTTSWPARPNSATVPPPSCAPSLPCTRRSGATTRRADLVVLGAPSEGAAACPTRQGHRLSGSPLGWS